MMATADELYMEAQWEAEGLRRAVERYREAAEAAEPASLPSGQRLLREVVPPLSRRIAELQVEGAQIRAGSRIARWVVPIQLLPADILAVLTVARSLRGAEDPGPGSAITPLSRDIAQAVRDEIEYRTWMGAQARANAAAREAGDHAHVDLIAQFRNRFPQMNRDAWRSFRRKLANAQIEPWDQETAVQLGAALLSALVQTAADRFEIAARPVAGGRTQNYLRVSDETAEVLRDLEERASVARPQLMPMLIPPIPWRYDAA